MNVAESTSPSEAVRKTLERRALELSRPARSEDPTDSVDVLVVQVGHERYGIDIHRVEEVRPSKAVTPVPGLPSVWKGLVNIRGVLRPVLDTARYLGVGSFSEDALDLVMIGENDFSVALLVERVIGLRRLRADEIDPPIADAAENHRKAVAGITADLLLLLDADVLLRDPQLIVDQRNS